MKKKLKEIFHYSDMIHGLIKRDLRGRYKGSALGFLWNFINPLCQIVVYCLVFSNIFRNDIDKYYAFIVIGMMPWIFFSDSLCQSSGCIVAQADMTKKIYFPREVLPISTVTSRLINLFLTFIVVFTVIIISGIGFNWRAMVYLPLVILIEYVMALAFALILSSINVYFRDFEYMTGVLTMAWIWLTPIMYSYDSVSGLLHWIVSKNPMTPVILSYQRILYYKEVPDFTGLGHSALFAMILLIAGEIIFTKLEADFAEAL